MPNRILREGILTSEAVNSLGWAEEVFYRRLLSVVDDFGRFYASPKLLRAACYPLHIDKVSDADIGKWLSSCETAALVSVYPAQDGKRYVQVLRFNQQVRAKESKFPQPTTNAQHMRSTCVADAQHMQANAHLDVSVFGVEDEGGGATTELSKVVDNSDKPPPMISDEFMEVLKSRPELDPDTVWQNFIEKNTFDKRTIGRWRKWVATEFSPPGVAVLSTTAPRGPDPELERIKRESAMAVPMPASVREHIQRLKTGASA